MVDLGDRGVSTSIMTMSTSPLSEGRGEANPWPVAMGLKGESSSSDRLRLRSIVSFISGLWENADDGKPIEDAEDVDMKCRGKRSILLFEEKRRRKMENGEWREISYEVRFRVQLVCQLVCVWLGLQDATVNGRRHLDAIQFTV